ncbi:MoaD/ThiS family protein [Lacunimicrobium album]
MSGSEKLFENGCSTSHTGISDIGQGTVRAAVPRCTGSLANRYQLASRGLQAIEVQLTAEVSQRTAPARTEPRPPGGCVLESFKQLLSEEMMVAVLLFAGARDAVGKDRITIEWAEAASVDVLRARLLEAYPEMTGLLKSAMFSRGTSYLGREALVQPGDEVGMIPSVSGG